MGRALVPQAIQEGADVYFECSVVSNPPYLRVEWFHDVSLRCLQPTFQYEGMCHCFIFSFK